MEKLKQLYTSIKILIKLIKLNKKFTIVTNETLQRTIENYPKVYKHYAELLEKEDVYSWYANEYDICNQDRTQMLKNLEFLNAELERKINVYNDAAVEFFVKDEDESGYYNKGKKDICQDIKFIVEDIIKRRKLV